MSDDFWGEPISRSTDQDALEDGTIVDISSLSLLFRGVSAEASLMRFQVAMAQAAARCVILPANNRYWPRPGNLRIVDALPAGDDNEWVDLSAGKQ